MAAIMPHLETVDDPAETSAERKLHSKKQTRSFDQSRLSAEVINQSHAELVQMVWLRRVVQDQLKDRKFRVQAGRFTGSDPRKVYIVLDGPLGDSGTGPEWCPATDPKLRNFSLLSWTSKMGSPSFSLPPGATQFGGTCPGSAAGQSIVPVAAMLAATKKVLEVTGEPVYLERSICQFCYAQGGQYSTANVQFAQTLRHVWVQQALKDGSFVPTMIYAVENANYYLNGKKGKTNKETGITGPGYLPERHTGRYFRIHDSGDFFNADYLSAWKQVANAFMPGNRNGFAPVMFWAPTRIWATNWGLAAVKRINSGPTNLIIRPSSFHVTEKEAKKKTCRNAKDPDGNIGCRACWRDWLEVNYTKH